MEKTVYISRSYLTDPSLVEKVKRFLEKENLTIREYTGGKYNYEAVKKSDFIIFLSYPHSKKGERVYVGRGVFAETLYGFVSGMPVFFYDGSRFFSCNNAKVFNPKDFQKEYGTIDLVEPVNIHEKIKNIKVRPKDNLESY